MARLPRVLPPLPPLLLPPLLPPPLLPLAPPLPPPPVPSPPPPPTPPLHPPPTSTASNVHCSNRSFMPRPQSKRETIAWAPQVLEITTALGPPDTTSPPST